MKFTRDDYARLDEAITPLDTGSTREAYRLGKFPRADKVTDLDVRYRWDLLWFACREDRTLYDVLDGYKSAHIDTVLRAIVPPLRP